MYSLMVELLTVLAYLLILGIPIGISILIYRLINKRQYDRRLRLIALVPILTLGYFIYTAFYPTADFYRRDFKEVTGLAFPENALILYKSASFPDNFGDYSSVSLVQVDKGFYEDLPKLLKTKGLTENQELTGPMDLMEILEQFEDKKIEREFSAEDRGVYYYVGLLSDKQTLIVNRVSW